MSSKKNKKSSHFKKEEMDDVFDLPRIIKKQAKKNAPFFKLDYVEQISVLDFIKSHNLDIRIFGEKWYDVLSKKFYVIEYSLEEKRFYNDVVKNEFSFDNFEDFYKFVGDNVYSYACLYGYQFSEEEILKFSIDVSKINFDSLIFETIDLYTFESILETQNKENIVKEKRTRDIETWFSKYETISSLSDLEKMYKSFTQKFILIEYQRIFFSLVIKKYKETVKEIILQYLCKHDMFDGLSFARILLTYGADAALYVIENFDGMCTYTTKRRRIKLFKRILEDFNEGPFNIIRTIGYDSNLCLYFVWYRYCKGNIQYFSIADYFLTFDELVKDVNGNLCSANFSNAPLKSEQILKYTIDSQTILPKGKTYKTYKIRKKYTGEEFVVEQKWYDSDNILVLEKNHSFKRFFNFVHFLKGDISEADFLLCEGIENIGCLKNLNIEGIKIKSDIAEKLSLPFNLLPKNRFDVQSFEYSQKFEIETVDMFLSEHIDDDYSDKVSYITDIHLLHRFDAYKCKTFDDVNYVIRTIAKSIGEKSTRINLIGGDTSSDFEVFEKFICNLAFFRKMGDFFFVLGNHELWGNGEEDFSSIVQKYTRFLASKGQGRMHLVQNSLFYLDSNWKEISEEELSNLSLEEIRLKTRAAECLIFGGIGFAGKNEEFNANAGIYENALTREEEINESSLFLSLYEKVSEALKGKNLIILTHMPMKDWGGPSIHAKEGFIYVNGHSHHNFFFDDGKKRIYADNQVGYKGKKASFKQISINLDYDWFQDYQNGIYEISKEDYEKFYRGIGEGLEFNRDYSKLFMIKRENVYMFLMQTEKGSLLILNGGAIKKAGNHNLEYFYKNLVKYSKSVSMFLSKYNDFQKQVSSELKKIGADGTIHGSIVDINFYNHLYLNPLDGSVTPYFANSMVEKYVYNNLPSLLKYECPEIYLKYRQLAEQKNNSYELIKLEDSFSLSKETIFVESTEMYRVSRILKGLQFTTKYNIVRIWNDSVVADASEENGRLIVSTIIKPSE